MQGHALTLGRVSGAVLLGKPLALSVLVQHAAEEDISAVCFEADVRYGDTPVERSRIAVTASPGGLPHTQVVRITSSATVDEALVGLTLRSGCGPRISRQYTLLADVLSEVAGPDSAAVANVAQPVPTPVPVAGSVVSGTAANASVAKPARTATNQAVVLPQAAPQADPPRKRMPPASGGTPAATKPEPSLSTSALEVLQRRVDAISERQAAKQEPTANPILEAEVRKLQSAMAKNQQSIQSMAAALESRGSSQMDSNVVYGLGALLLACVAALAYTAKRLGASGQASAPWWSRATPPPPGEMAPLGNRPFPQDQATGADHALPANMQTAYASSQHSVAGALTGATVGATEDAEDALSMDFTVAQPAPARRGVPMAASRPARTDFGSSSHTQLRAINTREMLDVRQQAEFFMALGQHDEAVRLLESSIEGSAESNPLVILDLLKILHTLSRRVEFERYREDFNLQFTGRIPAYADFLREGNGLEVYEDICQQIVVLWPTEYTVDYIEQCLVRLPEDDAEQGMDLEAFKDLLLLYGILKRLGQAYDSGMAAFNASRQEPLPNLPSDGPVAGISTKLAPLLPAQVAAVSQPLDIDLDVAHIAVDPSPAAPNNLIDFDMSPYMDQK